jgi:hypothetical protein
MPLVQDVHVNVPLTQISIAYMQNAAGFVADTVFPNIPVDKQSAVYFRYDRSDFARNQFQQRAPSTESAGSGWKIDKTANYFANVWALHKDVSDQLRGNIDDPLDMDRDATIWLSQQALIAREVTWAANNFATNIWKGIDGTLGDMTGVSGVPAGNQVRQWNDYVNSTPVVDIKTNSDAIMLRSFLRPNTLVVGRQVWTKLSEHPALTARIQYGNSNAVPTVLTRAAAGAVFEIDRVLVMDGVQVTSPENTAFETSMTTAFIAGKQALLCYANPAPSIMQPSGGYTFSWRGYPGAGLAETSDGKTTTFGMRLSKMRLEWLKSDRVESEMAYDQKLVCPEAGIFFPSIIA